MKISKQKFEWLQAEQGLSITKLAELSGISRQNISTIKLRGTCQPITVKKLANAFNVPVESLLETTED